jgi:hypothetical protein
VPALEASGHKGIPRKPRKCPDGFKIARPASLLTDGANELSLRTEEPELMAATIGHDDRPIGKTDGTPNSTEKVHLAGLVADKYRRLRVDANRRKRPRVLDYLDPCAVADRLRPDAHGDHGQAQGCNEAHERDTRTAALSGHDSRMSLP